VARGFGRKVNAKPTKKTVNVGQTQRLGLVKRANLQTNFTTQTEWSMSPNFFKRGVK
jgi:hypothetical protein